MATPRHPHHPPPPWLLAAPAPLPQLLWPTMSLKRKHKAEEPNDLTATDVMEFIQLRVGMPLCELIELKKSIDAEVDRRLEDGL